MVIRLLSLGLFATCLVSPLPFESRALDTRSPDAFPALSQAADQRAVFERWYSSQPRVYLPVSAEGAAVLIVKFSDYQCPPCAQSYVDFEPILARYHRQFPGAVKLVVKDFPLSPGCNPLVKQPMHAAACEAAVAVRLARRHNKAGEMEAWLYSHQATLTPASVREAASRVGGVTDFDRAYPQALEQVKADVGLGQALAVRQTPTFFINGVRFEGEPVPQFFDMAIAYELRKAGRLHTGVGR